MKIWILNFKITLVVLLASMLYWVLYSDAIVAHYCRYYLVLLINEYAVYLNSECFDFHLFLDCIGVWFYSIMLFFFLKKWVTLQFPENSFAHLVNVILWICSYWYFEDDCPAPRWGDRTSQACWSWKWYWS